MPKILEKEIEDYVFKNHNSIQDLDGDYILRQFNLKGYGILDLLIIQIDNDNKPVFKIVELKQQDINWQAVNQICRYIRGLIKNLEEDNKTFIDYSIEAYLLGEQLSQDICYLTDVLQDHYPSVKVITYDLDLQKGITFSYDNYGWYPTKRTKINLDKYIKKARTNHQKYEQVKNDKN